jgi:ubiquinone/menaquinone biosynthesis C-methylase UbiE
MRKSDFARLAEDYDRLRPVDETWWVVFDRLVQEAELAGRRVLDVGCGTGRLCAALAEKGIARAWGVDAEPKMVAAAREQVPKIVGLKEGRAEALPFRGGWFDRVVYWLVVHHVDRERAFAEAARVLTHDGKLAIVTFDPAEFHRHWLVSYFPAIERIDKERFPTPAQLETELLRAGFAPPRFVRVPQEREISREDALARIRARHVSTFDLLDADELAEGLERAERELPETVVVRREGLLVIADRAT